MNYQWLSFKKLICTICSAVIPNKQMRHQVRYALDPLNDQRVENYLKQQYVLPFFEEGANISIPSQTSPNDDTKYIWQCWLQGVDTAPDIVKACLKSVEKHKKKEQKVVIITSDNFDQYVNLPQYIIKKWKDGIISNAHFADILRINLLSRYGGYWIDATCLLTASTPNWMDETSLFMFHAHGEFSYTLIQNCFIHAKANDYLINCWLQLTHEVWKNESKLLHYFQHHLLLKAIISVVPKALQEYQNMPKVSEQDTQAFASYLSMSSPYSTDRLKEIINKSFMHKLTYKGTTATKFPIIEQFIKSH